MRTFPRAAFADAQEGDETWTRLKLHLDSDFSMAATGDCKCIAALPLLGGTKVSGAVLIGHSGPLDAILQQR